MNKCNKHQYSSINFYSVQLNCFNYNMKKGITSINKTIWPYRTGIQINNNEIPDNLINEVVFIQIRFFARFASFVSLCSIHRNSIKESKLQWTQAILIQYISKVCAEKKKSFFLLSFIKLWIDNSTIWLLNHKITYIKSHYFTYAFIPLFLTYCPISPKIKDHILGRPFVVHLKIKRWMNWIIC